MVSQKRKKMKVQFILGLLCSVSIAATSQAGLICKTDWGTNGKTLEVTTTPAPNQNVVLKVGPGLQLPSKVSGIYQSGEYSAFSKITYRLAVGQTQNGTISIKKTPSMPTRGGPRRLFSGEMIWAELKASNVQETFSCNEQ